MERLQLRVCRQLWDVRWTAILPVPGMSAFTADVLLIALTTVSAQLFSPKKYK